MQNTVDIDLIELEAECSRCGGNGKWREEGSGRLQICAACEGSGFYTTVFGEKVLNLLRHNLSIVMRSADDR